MRKLIEKRGMILRGLLLGVSAVVPVVLVALSAAPGGDVDRAMLSGSIAAEREAAHALLRSGEIEAGAVALLESLRKLPDDVELLEPAHGSLQLLAFTMVGLMPNDLLERFLAHLEPASRPVDALVLAYYARETEQYASWRGLEPFDAAHMWEKIDALEKSPSALVRAGGDLMAASPYLWTRIGMDEVGRMLEATNALAAALPSSRLATEVVREHVRACLGPNFRPLPDIQALFGALSGGDGARSAEEASMVDLAESTPIVDGLEAVQTLTTVVPWNEQAQAILATDPVVALARDAAALVANKAAAADGAALRQSCAALVEAAAANSEDASVRDWCLRSMVLVDGLIGPNTTDQEAAAIREASALPTEDRAADEPVPLDEARAALNQLIVAREHPEAAVLPADLKDVLMLPRQTEPVDINLFEQGPRRLAHYAYALVRRGALDEAAGVFDQLAALYPGSVLCDKWQEDATHLHEVAGL
jgi:hypothetical protein